jgi:hypothetical protein
MTATEYREIYESCRELLLSRMTVTEFYAAVRDRGISRLTAAMLLRDFYGLNLSQCISVDESHVNGSILDPLIANLVSSLCEVPNEPTLEPPTLCRSCEKPLRTSKAKQCFLCGADWHNDGRLE